MNLLPLAFLLALQARDVVTRDSDQGVYMVGHDVIEVDHACQQDLRAAQTVAALYVDPNGVYANLPDVEVWDEARDARQYAGPWPVVAHPPCSRWSIMSQCNPLVRHLDGQDGGCFAAALDAVTTWGGVLEHPAYSRAWRHFDLVRPGARGWNRSLWHDGWTCQVDQAMYGHPARKLTWLYYVGDDPPAMRWGDGGKQDENVRNMGDRKRITTPLEFRDALLAMSRPQGLTG